MRATSRVKLKYYSTPLSIAYPAIKEPVIMRLSNTTNRAINNIRLWFRKFRKFKCKQREQREPNDSDNLKNSDINNVSNENTRRKLYYITTVVSHLNKNFVFNLDNYLCIYLIL